MRIVYFTHSLVSCWNHGNAHFQRGLLRELVARGHDVVAYEPDKSWSRQNLARDHGEQQVARFAARFPELKTLRYKDVPDVAALLAGADLVIVHEWTDANLIAAIGRLRVRGGRFTLLFHDTHHRAVSEPGWLAAMDLTGYDGVLAFGRSLAALYERHGWGSRAFVFHEAADTRLFRPPSGSGPRRRGVVWVGNWGDGERSEEIARYLLRPARAARLSLDIYGVRYPAEALATLDNHEATYHGWIANIDVADVFARHCVTVHIPRRFYASNLSGIPTIRIFEALAAGIPLVTSPWDDCEGLFRPGQDYLVARDEVQMTTAMRDIAADPQLASALVCSGIERIATRHTCAHRADQLLAIAASLSPSLQGAA